MTARHGGRSYGAFELTSSVSELSALDRLFSSAVFQELAKKGRPLFSRLLCQAGVVDRCEKNATVGSAFDTAFLRLKTAGIRTNMSTERQLPRTFYLESIRYAQHQCLMRFVLVTAKQMLLS
jgi:hypothetical protein